MQDLGERTKLQKMRGLREQAKVYPIESKRANQQYSAIEKDQMIWPWSAA
jgi:hypothetical protein